MKYLPCLDYTFISFQFSFKSRYIDDVIALLFGEVEARQTGRVRDTVTKMLSQGKLSGRFESVPGKKGCYTLSCSLLEAQSPALSPR